MFSFWQVPAAAFGRARMRYGALRDRLGLGPGAAYKYTREVEAAALAGDVIAQARLATAYHEGLGVRQNPEKAHYWSTKAAHAGHPGPL